MFCGSLDWQGFHELPELTDEQIETKEIGDLTQAIAKVHNTYGSLPSTYKGRPLLRVVVVALVIIGITVGLLALSGSLLTFPQNFVHFFQTVNWVHAVIGFAVTTVLIAGAAICIHKVLHSRDKLLGNAGIGKLTGDEHWVAAYFPLYVTENKYINMPGYIDTSTLDPTTKSGKAYMYGEKDVFGHYGVSATMLYAPFLTALGAVSYDFFRLLIAPIYISVQRAREQLGEQILFPEDCLKSKEPLNAELQDWLERHITWNPGKSLKLAAIPPRLRAHIPSLRRFEWKDIGIQMGKSLWGIVQAPFYATAMVFAALYSLIDPLNGRKWGSRIEWEWNNMVPRPKAVWSVRGPQPLFRLEGGWGPDGLGDHAFYAAGCWQPVAVVTYENGKIFEASSVSYAINPAKGRPYEVKTGDMLREEHNAIVEAINEKLAHASPAPLVDPIS